MALCFHDPYSSVLLLCLTHSSYPIIAKLSGYILASYIPCLHSKLYHSLRMHFASTTTCHYSVKLTSFVTGSSS